MINSRFTVRLKPSLLAEAHKAAAAEGVALNRLINMALAEKLSVLRTDDYVRTRAAGADAAKAFEVLARAGKGQPPMPGDELPE